MNSLRMGMGPLWHHPHGQYCGCWLLQDFLHHQYFDIKSQPVDHFLDRPGGFLGIFSSLNNQCDCTWAILECVQLCLYELTWASFQAPQDLVLQGQYIWMPIFCPILPPVVEEHYKSLALDFHTRLYWPSFCVVLLKHGLHTDCVEL